MRIRRLRGRLMWLFGLFDRGRREREFAEELESRLALHTEDNIRAGMSPEEARRQAQIKQRGAEKIAVEIKSFVGASAMADLENALGSGDQRAAGAARQDRF